MRWRLFSCIAFSWLLAGCDGIAVGMGTCGTEALDASTSGCATATGLGIVKLSVPFTDVPTTDPADLPITWRVDNPCVGPCLTNMRLARAGGDNVWTVPRAGALPALRLIAADAGVTDVPLASPPGEDGLLQHLYITSDVSGAAYVHGQWASIDTQTGMINPSTGPELVFEVQNTPAAGATITRSLPLKQSRTPWPLGVLAVTDGFLFFNGDTGSGNVELMDAVGQPVLKNASYPIFTQDVGTSAVQTSAGYLFGAGANDPVSPVYGLLSTDTQLRYQQFAVVQDSTWRSVQVQPWAFGEYAVAAASDLVIAGALPGAGDGNIDVVIFPTLDAPVGYRVKRSCFNMMTLNGFTSDLAGNLYVSSVAGTQDAPRGLLCRMPQPVGKGLAQPHTPGCFQAEPNMLIGDIVAAGIGVLYAVIGPYDVSGLHLNDQIVRIELPAW